MSYKLIANYLDHGDDYDPPRIEFVCSYRGTPMFTFVADGGFYPMEWDNMVEACKSKDRTYVVDQSEIQGISFDGICNISVVNGIVNFTTAVYADDLGGRMKFSMPAKHCVKGFLQAAKIAKNCVHNNKP